MRRSFRKSIEAFLKAEGRLDLEKLGPAGKRRPSRSGKGSAVLKEFLRRAGHSQVGAQRICVMVLGLSSSLQMILAGYGLVTNNPPAVLAGGIGLLPIPISWILWRIGRERLLTELVGRLLEVLPSKEAAKIIEIVYRFVFGKPIEPHDPEESIPILFLSSTPTDLARLHLGREAREIQRRLRAAKLRHRFVLHQWPAATPDDLIQAMLDTQPEIVHFSGHGMDGGTLCFEDELGRTQSVNPAELAALFREFQNIRCVLLNACYTELQAQAIAEHVDYVIGAPDLVNDDAAIAFAVGFYQALGAGRTIDGAYELGCVAAGFQGLPKEAAPVLVRRNDSAERPEEFP